MKICKCQSTECSGQIKRYSIHSPSENTTYPNRFWGLQITAMSTKGRTKRLDLF